MSNQKKDYYGILGVDKDSDESAIKKAYYKLAQKWHPDKNRDNVTESENKFKEISEAYGILSDPQKKQQYDQFGVCDGESPDFSQGFPDLSEIFGGMGGFPFGGMGGMPGMHGMGGFPFGGMPGMSGMPGMRGERTKPKPVQEVKVKLKLSEIFNGTSKNIDISFNEMCNGCDGTGSKTKSRDKCQACLGRGVKVQITQIAPGMISQQQIPCGVCNQTGTFVNPKDICQVCNGKCIFETKLNKTLNISKDFDYESVMLLKNSGNYDIDLKVKADINISFKISDVDKYSLNVKNSHDLIMEHNISIHDAFTGYSMYWDSHPDGKKYLFKIQDIIKDGDVKFIKNLGLPNNDNKKNLRGKLYIQFKYIYPNSVLEQESFKTFIKNKESKSITDKESYVKEKVHDLKDDFNKSTQQHQQHHQQHQQQHQHHQQHQQHQFHDQEVQGCNQS